MQIFTPEKRSRRRYLLFSALTQLVLFVPTLAYPFSVDNSVYQAMALEWIRFGRLPDVGSWDMNFPGIILIHAIAIFCFGNSEFGFRLLELGFHIATAVLLFAILRRVLQARVAFLCVFVMCVLSATDPGWGFGERDFFASAFTLGATLLLYRIKDAKIAGPRLSNRSVLQSFCQGQPVFAFE